MLGDFPIDVVLLATDLDAARDRQAQRPVGARDHGRGASDRRLRAFLSLSIVCRTR